MIDHLAPVLHVSKVQENKVFFEKLGFKVEFEWDDPVDYLVLKRNQATIHLSKAIKPHIDSGQIDVYLFVENIKEYYSDLVKSKVEITTPLGQREYGMWDFDIKTPDGYNLSFGEGS